MTLIHAFFRELKAQEKGKQELLRPVAPVQVSRRDPVEEEDETTSQVSSTMAALQDDPEIQEKVR